MDAEKYGKSWFKHTFDKNYQHVLNYLFYLSGDAELSEDLAQDVFLLLWDKRLQIDDKTLRSYLFTIARNSFLKSIRRRKYDLKFRSELLENFETESPDYLLEMKEFDQKLQESLAALPERCRVIFLMNRMDGFTYREIAEALDISVKAVEKQMSKALSILREKIGGKL